jgi:hypothetical protein
LLTACELPFCSSNALSMYYFALTSKPYLSYSFKLKSLKTKYKLGSKKLSFWEAIDFYSIFPN